MQCRNCKNTLSGDEAFCPYCGTQQNLADSDISVNNTAKKQNHTNEKSSIFHSEPVYIYSDPPEEASPKKSKAAAVFVSLFIITLLIIGAVTLGDYFNLVPALSDILISNDTTESFDEEPSYESADTTLGVIAPDINFKSRIYTVSSQEGLPLRKGPDNSFAVIDNVSYGTDVQLIGRTLQNNIWGYVYIPSLDYYGWLMCSYLTDNSQIEEVTQEDKELTVSDTEVSE